MCLAVDKKRVQEVGLEPTRYCYHRHLKPARLPIPPFLHDLITVSLSITVYLSDKLYYTVWMLNCQQLF